MKGTFSETIHDYGYIHITIIWLASCLCYTSGGGLSFDCCCDLKDEVSRRLVMLCCCASKR